MDNNPWKHVWIDDKVAETNPYLNPKAPKPEPVPEPDPDPGTGSNLITGNYILMDKTNTYALGLHALQEACVAEKNKNHPIITLPDRKKVYRVNTFLENILARMNDWETLHDSAGNERTLEDRKRYFVTWLDSSCGIAYKAKTTKLKLQLVFPQLMGIAKDFREHFIPIDYAGFSGNATLDSSNKNFVRDGWMALLEGKTDVYNNYLATLKAIIGRDIVPDFWKRQNTADDELLAVCVGILDSNSSAGGNDSLNVNCRFLRVAPS